MQDSPGEITDLLAQLSKGNQSAQEKLIPLVYEELRRLAASYMRRERNDHTLQPTALVHEAYLKLIGQRETNWSNRAHFFGVAASLMRRILIDHARGHLRNKRGGALQRVSLDESLGFSEERSQELLAIDEALDKLEKTDNRQSRIVTLRFFGGLTEQEIAEVLNLSPRTVQREWAFAKAWLHGEIRKS
jgi:RNA polymerase sigma factor (TIGR02999 family)